MNNVGTKLKEHEGEILTQSYKIALIKQDIALNLIDVIKEIIEREHVVKIPKEKIADMVFNELKNIPNSEIEKYMGADLQNKPKIKLKIERRVLKSLRSKDFVPARKE